jgi:hypothetical protein
MGQSWQGQMCPILTVALQTPPKAESAILTSGAKPIAKPQTDEFPAFPCHGPACAWFQPIANEQGQVVDGKCAVPALAMGFGAVANILDSLRRVAIPVPASAPEKGY